MSEAELQRRVLKLCREYSVLAFHDNDSRRNDAGYPDLTLVGIDGVAWAELKAEHEQLRREQTIWRYRILAAGQRCYVWRPADLHSGAIDEVLSNL
ncbi:MAG TPA: hypothetical protein VGM53_11085 [Streptosporangiaceae bacterium]|jgi:hypothetical protein